MGFLKGPKAPRGLRPLGRGAESHKGLILMENAAMYTFLLKGVSSRIEVRRHVAEAAGSPREKEGFCFVVLPTQAGNAAPRFTA